MSNEDVNDLKSELASARNSIEENNERIDNLTVRLKQVERNHKYEGELYILSTDQGYINQPDLVWEKLNEVNGDTVYMTGNFKEFKVEDHSNSTWHEKNAIDSTADYLASIDGGSLENLTFKF
ncbi:Protein of unknown function (DUF544) [Abeliophyllum distichum]|uniref:MINDY deubiquitinase domain-containing protein n=1 Tax=Abeliophyllum distichum TaxID=126358 RepID=A0ABD1V6E0_9LAMI